MQIEDQYHFINGKYTGNPAAGFDNIYPATGNVLCKVALAGEAEVNQAIEAAEQAQKKWARFSTIERGRILLRTAEILRARNDSLAHLEVMDTGKPLREALSVDIASAAEAFEYFGAIAASIEGSYIDIPDAQIYTRREPLGIVGGIGAWNYPLQIAAWKTAPALACGNAMVFKPSEMTPITAGVLGSVLKEAGLPDGLYNVIHGAADTGRLLTRSRVQKISFTGEVKTGKAIIKDTADTLKVTTMELGGKSPLLIFDDADIKRAVQVAMAANFYTQGEVCTNGTRVYVQRKVYEQFIKGLLAEGNKIVIGDPMQERTNVGALINEEHYNKVKSFIEEGKSSCKVMHEMGNLPEESKLAGGYFVKPVVFEYETEDDSLCREEIFGPVMTVLPFDDEEEVIARSNNSPYGLAAGLVTENLRRGHRVAARLDAGIVWINNYNVTPLQMPFGGVKQSGLGRENGKAAIEHFTRLKSVYVELGEVEDML